MEQARVIDLIPISTNTHRVRRKQWGVVTRPPLLFQTVDGHAFRLKDAFVNSESLDRHDQQVLQGMSTKYSIIINLEGQPVYSRQKYAHAGGRRKQSNTLGKVARQIAEVVQAYIENDMHRQTGDTQWRLGGEGLGFDDLYLLELHQVSKSSFEPVFGIRGPL
ncbi:hypothetical protein BDW22DRAFT_376468 [Trametopsis cervina]|nr:hypothetical protein BDW22DRAFT_376468 [Trametopsis cervina]